MSTIDITESATAIAFAELDEEMRTIIKLGGHSTEWDHHIGQDKAKRLLQRAAKSAKMRNVTLGHILLASPYAGIGKTSLAILTALEMGRGFRIVSGKVTLREMRTILDDMLAGDVLIIDECHLLVTGGKSNSEWLLPYMQSGTLIGPLGPEDYPQVTIIGTTTDAGKLPGPIRDRFAYAPPLENYSDDDAAAIAIMQARSIFPTILAQPSPATAYQVAMAAANRPRQIRTLVALMLDLAIVGEITGPEYDMGEVLDAAGLTTDGLNTIACDYLRILGTSPGQDPVGMAVLGEQLGEAGGGLGDLERLLMDKDLVARTGRGRILTRAGITRYKELVRDGAYTE